jgi:integrase
VLTGQGSFIMGNGIYLDRKTVAALTEPAIHFDSELKGFGVRVRPNGNKSYVVQYRCGGAAHRLKIGDCTVLTPDQAREQARKLLAQATLGTDPADERKTARTTSAMTFSKAVAEYLDLKQRGVRSSSLKLTALYLTNRKYFGALHGKPLTKIDRSDVSSAVNKITVQSGARSALQARKHASAFFKWCIENGHADENPVIHSTTPEVGPARDRVLKDHELAAVWNACQDDDYGRIVKLLMLTGCRRAEIGGLKWSEIDLDGGTITLPKERVKNGREHVLPITPLMASIFASVPRMLNRDHLFGKRGFTRWQKFHLDTGITKPFVLHDLRRSLATGMAERGMDPHIIEAVLNHASGHKAGVAGIYNRATYAPQMKNALNSWSNHIGALVGISIGDSTDSNVIPLRA